MYGLPLARKLTRWVLTLRDLSAAAASRTAETIGRILRCWGRGAQLRIAGASDFTRRRPLSRYGRRRCLLRRCGMLSKCYLYSVDLKVRVYDGHEAAHADDVAERAAMSKEERLRVGAELHAFWVRNYFSDAVGLDRTVQVIQRP